MNETENLQKLRNYLQNLEPGETGEDTPLEELLSQCWHELKGDDGGMEGYKLIGRMEDVAWNPPILTFRIERHGGTVQGSVYAEMQAWTVDAEKGTASCNEFAGRRLVGERDKPFKAGPVAKEIARLVTRGKKDPRLKWKTESKVRILVSEVVPATNQQTTTGRRRRFWRALQQELSPHGWVVSGQFAVKQDTAEEPSRDAASAAKAAQPSGT